MSISLNISNSLQNHIKSIAKSRSKLMLCVAFIAASIFIIKNLKSKLYHSDKEVTPSTHSIDLISPARKDDSGHSQSNSNQSIEAIALQWKKLERGEYVDTQNLDSIFQVSHWNYLVAQLSHQIKDTVDETKIDQADVHGGHLLPSTREQKLIASGFEYFQNIATVEIDIVLEKSSIDDKLQAVNQTRAKIERARDQFLTFVPGIRLIKEVDSENPDRCYNFVFDFAHRDWCKISENKLASLSHAINLLKDNDFIIVDTPQAGDIIAYYDNDLAVKHYGKVTKINEEGNVLITSKFGDGHIYEHQEDRILPGYGEHKIYFRRELF